MPSTSTSAQITYFLTTPIIGSAGQILSIECTRTLETLEITSALMLDSSQYRDITAFIARCDRLRYLEVKFDGPVDAIGKSNIELLSRLKVFLVQCSLVHELNTSILFIDETVSGPVCRELPELNLLLTAATDRGPRCMFAQHQGPEDRDDGTILNVHYGYC
jgi:hypothetical protein